MQKDFILFTIENPDTQYEYAQFNVQRWPQSGGWSTTNKFLPVYDNVSFGVTCTSVTETEDAIYSQDINRQRSLLEDRKHPRMGLTRRAKVEGAASTSSRFLAFFSHKRPHHGRNLEAEPAAEHYKSPSNVQVDARVARDTPCVGVFPQRSSRSSSLQYSTRSSSSRSSSSSVREALSRDHDDLAARRRNESDVVEDAEATDEASAFLPREMWRESSVDEFLACFPRDLTADVRVTCNVTRPRAARRFVHVLIASLEFEIRTTKWAAYFLQLVRSARREKRLSQRAAVSVKWAICAYVQGEAHARQEQQKRVDVTLQRKMTEYRVALQCVAGTSVVKFGRKGRPHGTNLCVENGDTLRWTSKLLAHATHMAVDGVAATTTMGKKRVKAKNAIPLASITRVSSGPSTSVLTRALHKGTLLLEDAGCTLSVVTHTRTLDLKAKTAEEREWLQRSLEFLVDLARDHERRVAQQVELTIMKRMETLAVWKFGRKGRPHKTRVFVDRFGEVSWLGRSGDSLQLDEIVAVHEGQQTPVFARARAAGRVSPAIAAHCFSLVTTLRSLDIQAVNEQQRDWFVVAFRYLLDKVHEKTAAMQRERAERQLRMLQDLSHEDEEDNYLTGDGDDMYYDERPPARHA